MDAKLLHHELIHAPGAEPQRRVLFLHGIFGAGRNWATIARRVVERRPEWGALLVDLREHGRSTGFPPPHALEAAAADVRRLTDHLNLGDHAVVGHSFGGKVALTLASAKPPGLRQLWIIDSTPAPRPPGGQSWQVMQILQNLPGPFASRADAVAQLQAEGIPPAVATWIATNVQRDGEAYTWRLDLAACQQLLADFYTADLWPIVEDHPASLDIHFLCATQSDVMDAATTDRAKRTAAVHEIVGGHWLNIDNPDAVVELITADLPVD